MGDDQRVSRNTNEPATSESAGAARWSGYLDWVRGDIIAAVTALPPSDQRSSRLPSGWTPIELLNHVFHMEQRWFVWGFLGEPVDHIWGDWGVPDGDGGLPGPRGRWAVPADVTAEDIARSLRALGSRTRTILSEQRLDATAAPGGRFRDDPPTLEWICFHVLAEYARHAGHLDVVTEIATTRANPAT